MTGESLPRPSALVLPLICDHFIEIEGDRWAGTYCKLPAGHGGPHSAHYPKWGRA